LQLVRCLSAGSDNPYPYNGGLPGVSTKKLFQNTGSGVYLHIRQQLLAPPAASLIAGTLPTILIKDIFLSVTAFIYSNLSQVVLIVKHFS